MYLPFGLIFDNEEYSRIGKLIGSKLTALIQQEPRYMANWAVSIAWYGEIVIVGERAQEVRAELAAQALPNQIFMVSNSKSDLPLIKDRIAIDGNTTIYVCRNKTCQLPVKSVQEALRQLNESS